MNDSHQFDMIFQNMADMNNNRRGSITSMYSDRKSISDINGSISAMMAAAQTGEPQLDYSQKIQRFFFKIFFNHENESNEKLVSSNIQLQQADETDHTLGRKSIHHNDFEITSIDMNDDFDMVLKFTDPIIEFDFFKVLFISVIMNQPKCFVDKLIQIDP